jgi:outer membrane immunogenic protein
MKTILLATSALLVASAAPAFAQDATTPPADATTTAPAPMDATSTPAPADTASTTMTSAPSDGATFTGPRAEIFGGWDRVASRRGFNDATGNRVHSRDHDSAWTGGGLIGYDVPLGTSLTAGVFGSYAVSTSKTCTTLDDSSRFCRKPGRDIEGGARIGYKLGNRALVYGKGAYVNGQLRQVAAYEDGTYAVDHKNRNGWRAGAGVEFAVTNHAYVKAEYDYTRYQSFKGNDLGIEDATLRYNRNQVLAGFGVHF